MTRALTESAARLVDWVSQQALPLWHRVGLHPELGGHCERLLPDGRPDWAAEVRGRVQARQAYVFALGAQRGWYPPGEAVAPRLLALLAERAAHPEGGYIHRLDARFLPLDRHRDLYDHAFYLLAHAWAYRTLGDAAHLADAEALVAFIDRELGADNGGWLEGDYAAEHRRQNPHMHLLEAFLALFEATGEGRWLARAGEIHGLFVAHFYDAEQQVLKEYFRPDWRLAEGQAGELVEPGHMFEWVWLLRWYARLSGRPVSGCADALYRRALALGLSERGLVWDAVDVTGRVLKASHRCWPMTELIKASLAQARAGHPDGERRAAQAIDALFDTFLSVPTPGAYIDQVSGAGEVLVDVAPASTLYHLASAAAEAADYAELERSP